MATLKKILSLLLRISISALLIYYLLRQVDFKSLVGIIRAADKNLLLLSLLIYGLAHVFCLLRWNMLLKASGIHIPLRRVVLSFAGGLFFNLFLPSTIGGDLMRSIDLAAHTRKAKEVVATVFLDRISGFIGLVSVALIAIILGWRHLGDTSVLLTMAIITGILLLVILACFSRFFHRLTVKVFTFFKGIPASGKALSLFEEIHSFPRSRPLIFKNIFLSVLVQLVPPASFYVSSLALGIKVNVLYFFIFIPIVNAITMLPISIGGLGLRDVTTIYFLAKAGIAKDLAFSMSLFSFFIVIFYGVIGGLIYVLTVHHRRLQPDKTSSHLASP